MNQRRITTIKFLGELFNYMVVDSKVIFNTLKSLLSFYAMHPVLDPADNYMRIKLACTLMDTCGDYFTKGKDGEQFDMFLVYLQRYMFYKAQPLPMDTEFALSDTLERLRPKLALFETLEEAQAAVVSLETEMRKKMEEELRKQQLAAQASAAAAGEIISTTTNPSGGADGSAA